MAIGNSALGRCRIPDDPSTSSESARGGRYGPSGQSTTWPRSRGLNDHERARFRSSWSDPEELALVRRKHLVFDRRHAALLAQLLHARAPDLRMHNFRHLALDLVEQIFDQGIVQRTDQEIPAPRRVERQLSLRRVPQQAGRAVNFLQRELMKTLPASAKLKSDVLTRSIG